jgi:hypothetical protein
MSDIEDAVTGQCDHIVGFLLGTFPQHGDVDRLTRESEDVRHLDLEFNYCPLCGGRLGG